MGNNRDSGFPEGLRRLLWEYRTEELAPDSPIVIERVLEFGDIEEVRYLLRHVKAETIKEFIVRYAYRLSSRSLNYWRRYFEVSDASTERIAH